MTRPNNCQQRRRRWMGAAAAVPLAALAPQSHAVTFYSTGDPNYNITAPVASLANTAWGYSGNWSSFTGTAIAPQYFITAAHVGGSVGDNFFYNGTNYQTIPFADASPFKRIETEDNDGNVVNTDLIVWKIAGTFSSFAGLWKTSVDGAETTHGTAANPVVVIGRGTQRGSDVLLGGDVRGWQVGVQDGVRRWGTNVISGTSGLINIGSSWGAVIGVNFDANPADRPGASSAGYSGVNEAIMTKGDSGGGIFIKNAAGKWKLAGVTWAVTNGYSYAANGTPLDAPLFDIGGFYQGSTLQSDTAADKPVIGYASQISANFEAINGLLTNSWAWNVDANGNWTGSSNWWNAEMNTNAAANSPPQGGMGAGKEVVFGSVITAPRTVTLNQSRQAGTLLFDGPNPYTLAGTSTLTLESASAGDPVSTVSINVTSGNHTIATPVVLNKNTTINVRQAAATLTMTGTITAPGATITKTGAGTLERPSFTGLNLVIAAGTAKIMSNGTAAGTSSPGSLTLNGGRLDVTNNDLVLNYTGTTIAETVRGWLASARNGGAWNGTTGITSSTAASHPNLATTLAFAEASTLLGLTGTATGTWSGQTADATTILIKYTYYGDANFDGTVTTDDYTLVDRGRAIGLTGWINGDFNYDNAVDAADYALIDRAFAFQSGALSPSLLATRQAQFGADYVAALLISIPEPTSIACLAPTVPLLLRRRRYS